MDFAGEEANCRVTGFLLRSTIAINVPQADGALQGVSCKQRFPLDSMATTAIMFSRCLYAQLAQQAFEPPACFPMPPAGDASRRAAELGMKLTVGMEMMCSSKARAERSAGRVSAGSLPVRALCLARYVGCSVDVRMRIITQRLQRRVSVCPQPTQNKSQAAA